MLGMYALTQGKRFVCGGIVVIPLTTIPGKKEVEGKDCNDSLASCCTASKEIRQDLASLNTFLCPEHYLIIIKKPSRSCLRNPARVLEYYFSNQKTKKYVNILHRQGRRNRKSKQPNRTICT